MSHINKTGTYATLTLSQSRGSWTAGFPISALAKELLTQMERPLPCSAGRALRAEIRRGRGREERGLRMENELRAFRRIVEHSWGELASIARDRWDFEELVNEWLEVNWEMIVEGALRFEHPNLVLAHYGEGADNPNARVLNPGAKVTHFVCCRPKDGDTLIETMAGESIQFPERGLPMKSFVACEPGQCYRIEPPHDSVLLYEFDDRGERVPSSGYPLVFPLFQLTFFLTESGF